MILEGAIKLFDNNDYTIYTMNSVVTGQYGVVVPKNVNGVLNMLIDLHFKSSFDAVGSGIKTTDMLVNEINEEYGNVKARYADGMLVLPMIDETSLANVIATGDKQKMFDEVKKISSITSELYKKLMDSGVEKQKIDQKIIVVEKNDSDEKFVAWLKEQTPGFIDGVLYSELSGKVEEQSTVANSGNSLFGSPVGEVAAPVQNEAEASQPEVVGGIFDSVSPVADMPNVSAEQNVVEPVVPVESTNAVAETPITPINPLDSSAVPNSVDNQTPVTSVGSDIFGTPSDVATPVTPVIPNVSPEPAIQSTPTIANLGAIEGPKPVESTDLEATALFNPIPNNSVSAENNNTAVLNNVDSNNVQDVQNSGEELNPNKSNGGFVNLIILVVILIGVTIVSIELGKFLYSVYGA